MSTESTLRNQLATATAMTFACAPTLYVRLGKKTKPYCSEIEVYRTTERNHAGEEL